MKDRKPPVQFRPYQTADRSGCLALFDDNCPEFFAPNERRDYVAFLDGQPPAYELGTMGNTLVAAYGACGEEPGERVRINWIMVAAEARGLGLGAIMIDRAISRALHLRAPALDIAASHLSAPFFSRFGARVLKITSDGWGPGMHRVDMELAVNNPADGDTTPEFKGEG